MPTRRWPGSRFLLAVVVSALFLTLVGRTLFVPRGERSGQEGLPAATRKVPRAGETPDTAGAPAPEGHWRIGKPEEPGKAILSGRVLDPGGSPSARAQAFLRRPSDVEADAILERILGTRSRYREGRPAARVAELALEYAPVVAEAPADDGGCFAFQIQPGRYLLVVRAEAWPSWVSLPLAVQGRLEIEILLAEGTEIRGKVLDGKGRPSAAAVVSASLAERDRLGGESLPFFPEDLTALLVLDEALRDRQVTTGDDGSFRVSGLLDFKYDLKARAHGHAPGEARGVRGGSVDLEILLEAGRAVRGRVQTPGGIPAAGATAAFFRIEECFPRGDGNSGSSAAAARAVTDSQGRFESPPLPHGAYRLEVQGEGFQETALEFALDEGPESLFVEVTVLRGLRLQGRIAGKEAGPLSDLEVRIVEVSQAPGPDGSPSDVPAAEGRTVVLHTDRDGRFFADTLRDGPHRLEVPARPPYPAFRRDVTPGEREISIVLPEGSLVVLGRAIEAGTEAPVHRARAILLPCGDDLMDRQEATPDEDGRFRFFSSRGGKARVEVRSPRHLTVSTSELMLDPSGLPSRLTLELPRAGVIEGVVLTPAGEPVPGARVQCEREELEGAIGWAGWARPALTKADGSFALYLSQSRPGGTYWLSAVHPARFLAEEIPVEVEDPSRGVTGVKMILRPAATLKGTLTCSSLPVRDGIVQVIRLLGGAPEPGAAPGPAERPAHLPAASPPGIAEAESPADARGRFEIRGLRPGTYRLVAAARNSAPCQSEPFFLDEGAELTVEVPMEPEKTIQGTIVDAAGNALEGARVSAVAAGSGRHAPAAAISGRSGRYILRGLAATAYSVKARKSGFATQVRQEVWPSGDETGFVLLAHGGLAVTVADLHTREPVVAFFLDLLPDEEDLQIHEDLGAGNISSPMGEFHAAGVPPGRYRLVVAARGYLVHESPLTVESGKVAEAAVSLDPGEGIAGTVMDAAGLPVEGARVVAEALSPAEGSAGCPSGDARTSGNPAGRESGPEEADPPAGRSVAPPALVPARRPGPPLERLESMTDPEGRFTIHGLEAGTYRLLASHARYLTAASPPIPIPSSVDPGEILPPIQVRLILQSGATVSGRVLSRSGEPLPGVEVGIRRSNETRRTRSDDRGGYRFFAVPAGAHALFHSRGEVRVECGALEVPSGDLEVERDIVVDED